MRTYSVNFRPVATEVLEMSWTASKKISKSIANTAKKAEEFARGIITGGTLFEELGFYYIAY